MQTLGRRIAGQAVVHSRSRLGFATALLFALVAAASAALVGIVTSSATAAFPGENGKIVFQTNRDLNEEIYTMNPDGTNRVNLTRDPALDIDPHWSADGTQIVFASTRDGNHEIYRMNADGSDVTQLTSRAASSTGGRAGRTTAGSCFTAARFPTATSTGSTRTAPASRTSPRGRSTTPGRLPRHGAR